MLLSWINSWSLIAQAGFDSDKQVANLSNYCKTDVRYKLICVMETVSCSCCERRLPYNHVKEMVSESQNLKMAKVGRDL